MRKQYHLRPGDDGLDARDVDRLIELSQVHRIARALLEGRQTILAVQFEEPVPPDYRNCHPDDLPYD